MLERELETLMTVDHPNILKIHEVFEDEAFLHLVTELCTGGELFDQIILKQRFTEHEAAHIMYQLFHAVCHLHNHDISHRDIKPENILFVSSGTRSDLKLIDFGLAKKFSKQEELHSLVGTAHYLAPEVLQHKYSHSCDVWSLGVIMYMLLSGRPPFGGENTAAVFSNIAQGKYSLDGPEWESVSREAKQLIRETLTVQPELRITAGQALEHPWIKRKFCEGLKPLTRQALMRLQEYEAGNQFRRMAMNVMMRSLRAEELQDLTNVFRTLDKDHTGYISAKELHDGLRAVGVELGGEEVEEIIRKADLAGNGKINYSEFLWCTIDQQRLLSRETKWFAFKYFDTKDQGFLTHNGIKRALKRVRNSLSEEEISRTVTEAHLSQLVDFEQFCKIFDGGKA